VYLLVGDDDAEIVRLTAELTALVEDELRAFNVERLYAGEKGVTAASIAEAARMLPMMSDRRVVVVLRGERLLKPKRRGRVDEIESSEDEPAGDADALVEYLQRPEPSTTLVVAASDVDRTRKIWKSGFQKHAVVVECWGLKGEKDPKYLDLRAIARRAEQLVRQAAAEAGQQIDPAAARLVAERAGADIVRLRGDLDRLLLFAAGKPKISLADAREVVSAESSQDNWAVTTAIQQGNSAEALRQLALALDSGAVPYMVLGQLAWFVREKLADPRRIKAAVDALFRTDLDLKTSGGDPRVLLERLVVELCGARESVRRPSAW
ncbi:MAG TPA: DNA polymerase III subunit delta, partial [Vicinamibacterales bacterium]|nr:DNA polymerase III subunit delta [Vicinamibacterales bacterium]